MNTKEFRADVFRTLYVNAKNGMSLRLLHEGLKRLDPAGDVPSCLELVQGGRRQDSDDREHREDTVLTLLENVERRAMELGLVEIWRREETLALLGVAKRLARLGVHEVVVGAIPLPPEHCANDALRNDVLRELLSRFSGHESGSGVGVTAALLLDVLGAEQCGELCGMLVLASQIPGEEGMPFTLVLMEQGPGDGMCARDWDEDVSGAVSEAVPLVVDGAFEDGAGKDGAGKDGAGKDGAGKDGAGDDGGEAGFGKDRARDHAPARGEPDEADEDEADGDGSDEATFGDGVFETIVQLETNVDHITGEEIGAAIDALTADGRVLDVLWLSGLGKKNRPTGLLRVLCKPCHRMEVLRLVLRHTHTLGVREQEIRRFVAHRLSGSDELSDQSEVSAKHYKIEGRWYSRPESDDVVARARKTGVGAPALRFAQPGIHGQAAEGPRGARRFPRERQDPDHGDTATGKKEGASHEEMPLSKCRS